MIQIRIAIMFNRLKSGNKYLQITFHIILEVWSLQHFPNSLLFVFEHYYCQTVLFSSLILFLRVTSVTPAAFAISSCVIFSPALKDEM
jgi:hypothetical protein